LVREETKIPIAIAELPNKKRPR
jgi:hypothetical protein